MGFFTILTTKVGVVSADLGFSGVLSNMAEATLNFTFIITEKQSPEISLANSYIEPTNQI
jgi:hypothetical protein